MPASYVQIGSAVLPADHDIPSPTHVYDDDATTWATASRRQQCNGDFRAAPAQEAPGHPAEDAEMPVENGVQAAYSTSDYEVQAALTTLPIMPSSGW